MEQPDRPPNPPPAGVYSARRNFRIGGKKGMKVIACGTQFKLLRTELIVKPSRWIFYVEVDGSVRSFIATIHEFTNHFRKESLDAGGKLRRASARGAVSAGRGRDPSAGRGNGRV